MTVHQCPKCELRFSWTTELDDHCREEHPTFRHEYPVGRLAQPATAAQTATAAQAADEPDTPPQNSPA